MQSPLALLLALTTFAACQRPAPEPAPAPHDFAGSPLVAPAAPRRPESGTRLAAPLTEGESEAVFAGGCFWCMERPFEDLPGVLRVESGYTGGAVEHPTYDDVSAGRTGHYEAVRVVFDSRISYERLLEVFFHNVDPTDAHGQFCDQGSQYRSAIFVANDAERAAAEAAVASAASTLRTRVVTPVLPRAPFYVAEAYHQDFYRTHPDTYARYRSGCGRDARLRTLWGEGAGH